VLNTPFGVLCGGKNTDHAQGTVEGRRKGRRPRERWRDEVEYDFSIMGMYVITRQAVYCNVTLRCVRTTTVVGEKQ
jgi:hypothetical protein